MARRKYPPRVSRNWRFLWEMQQLVGGGMTPNAAAVRIASQHWRVITNGTYEAAVHWLKYNQRRFSAQLQGLDLSRMTPADYDELDKLGKRLDALERSMDIARTEFKLTREVQEAQWEAYHAEWRAKIEDIERHARF